MAMYDVIVVGAGPGGSSAARACAKKGLTVLLIDQAEFPRYKLCGGGVTEAARRLLGFNIPKEIAEREARGMRFIHENVSLEFKSSRRVVTMVMRDAFDNFLAEKAVDAGAEFAQGERVLGMKKGSNCVELATSKGMRKARCAIGADGITSVLASSVRPPFHRDEIGATVGAEIPAKEKEIDREFGDMVEIETGMLGFGYGWIFPKRRTLSFGYGAYLDNSAGVRGALIGYLGRHGFRSGYKITGHMIPFGGTMKRCWGNRILLAGDAAGFADPFHGEGIRYAIRSGQIASEVLATALEDSDLSEKSLAHYGARCYDEFGRELKWARRLARVVYRDFGLFFHLAKKNPSVLENYCKTIFGELGYKEFFLWSAPRFPMFALKSVV